MPAPYDLRELHALRRRGQCPALPVFITDNWDLQRKLVDFGALCIRVRNHTDIAYDWTAIRGLHCILLCREGEYTDLGIALLEAGPSTLETFHREPQRRGNWYCYSRLVVGPEEPIQQIVRRDTLLFRFLRN
jgi:hypothetical protein